MFSQMKNDNVSTLQDICATTVINNFNFTYSPVH
jgi:hypothetical protein